MLLSTSLQNSGLQDFLKRLLPKLSATRTLRLCRSLCLRHLRDIVFMLSPPCSPPLCVPFICSRLALSLHISEEPAKLLKIESHTERLMSFFNRSSNPDLILAIQSAGVSRGRNGFARTSQAKSSQRVKKTSSNTAPTAPTLSIPSTSVARNSLSEIS